MIKFVGEKMKSRKLPGSSGSLVLSSGYVRPRSTGEDRVGSGRDVRDEVSTTSRTSKDLHVET